MSNSAIQTSTAQPLANPKIRLSHWLSLISYLLLLVLLVMTTLLYPPPAQTSLALVLGVKLVPLLILLPGLLKASDRSHIWLCFVVLLYFTQTVLDVTATQGAWPFILMCSLTLVIFLSSMMHVHWVKKAAKQALAQ